MINFFKKIKNIFFLDQNEQNFKRSILKINKSLPCHKKHKLILFALNNNYYDLCFSYLLSREKKYQSYNILFYRPFYSFHKTDYKKNLIIFIFYFYLNNLIFFIKHLKWKNLAFGISKDFISFNNSNIFEEKVNKSC